ncbi:MULTISPECIES: recombinase family protein [Citricoccus]|uniref:recombinase family protein n=1 Tax=Citricoccus TaxID=169133 RepID=UPI00135C18CA
MRARSGDTLLVWKLERLGRDLRHRVNIVHNLTERGACRTAPRHRTNHRTGATGRPPRRA